MSLRTPLKTGAVRDCCVEGQRRDAHRAEAACGWFARRVPCGETSRRAGNRHVRFDERGMGNGALARPQATAPILDSTDSAVTSHLPGTEAIGGKPLSTPMEHHGRV